MFPHKGSVFKNLELCSIMNEWKGEVCMGFLETIEGYLATKNEENRNVYVPRIYSFATFLQNEKNVTDKNYKEYLSAMKVDVVIQSLENFIISNHIKKKSVAFFYAKTVKKYFVYLNDIGIENEELLKSFAYTNAKSYDNIIRKYIENNETLKMIETKDAVDFEEIKLLITSIDEQIEECIKDDDVMTCMENRYNPYNNLVYLLGLKLMIFTGIDYAGIRKLESGCFDSKKLKITINTYTIHLPDNLGEQLTAYETIKCDRGIKGDNFFLLCNEQIIPKETYQFSYLIEDIIGRGDTSGIRKYAITEMIRKGINQSFIMKLTNVGLTIFEDCQNTVNTERHVDANRYIDSKMRDMRVFDYL